MIYYSLISPRNLTVLSVQGVNLFCKLYPSEAYIFGDVVNGIY